MARKRYSIMKVSDSRHPDKFLYGFVDGDSVSSFGVALYCDDNGEFLLIENPSDAIAVCNNLNKEVAS